MKTQNKTPTLRDVSPEYAKTEARLAELLAKKTHLTAQLADVQTQIAADQTPGAATLLTAADLDAALAGPGTESLQAHAADLSRRLHAVTAALVPARRAMEAAEKKARRTLGEKVSKRYQDIARREALALIEIGLAHEAYHAFQRELPTHVAALGLAQFPLNQFVSNTQDGTFPAMLNRAVEAGFIKATEVPKQWPIKARKAA